MQVFGAHISYGHFPLPTVPLVQVNREVKLPVKEANRRLEATFLLSILLPQWAESKPRGSPEREAARCLAQDIISSLSERDVLAARPANAAATLESVVRLLCRSSEGGGDRTSAGVPLQVAQPLAFAVGCLTSRVGREPRAPDLQQCYSFLASLLKLAACPAVLSSLRSRAAELWVQCCGRKGGGRLTDVPTCSSADRD
jgi:hypothetical protein